MYETELTFLEMPAVEGMRTLFCYRKQKLVTKPLSALRS